MPHKHTRRKGDDGSHFDLAPSVVAKPLPAYSNNTKTKKKKRNPNSHISKDSTNGYKHDDTPRAFARMMQLQTSSKRQRLELDNGESQLPKKRRKAGLPEDALPQVAQDRAVAAPIEKPKILPGERLGDFAARVDQAMPVGNLKRKDKVKIEGVKERQTKTEKRLHKMYAAWREEDAKWKEKVEEQQEQEEEAAAELGEKSIAFVSKGKRKRRAEKDDDPWKELTARRGERSRLHDVVQAPPTLNVVPKERFKTTNGAQVDVENVPANAGSLKRREDLSEARKKVIERYRAMMGKEQK